MGEGGQPMVQSIDDARRRQRTIGRVPPHNLEAEESLLGAMLLSREARTPATSNASRYARIVEDHALLRRLIGVAGEIADLGYDLPEDVAMAIDRAEAMVYEVAQKRVTDSMMGIGPLLEQSLDH